MASCNKCGGLVVVTHDEAKCINCGAYYFSIDPAGDICSQGGTCGREAAMDGLCQKHWQQRMDMVNRGRAKGFRLRR